MNVIFLDRDGTINQEVDYLYKINEFRFIEGTIEALKIFSELGYKVIVISNQSGIARGYFQEDDILNLHNYINNQLSFSTELGQKTNLIYSYYYCPHHPKGIIKEYAIKCDCRKPGIGMIKKAIEDLNELGLAVDLERSFIVGDKESDVIAGENASIRNKILLRSGHKIDENNTVANNVFNNLYEFAQNLKDWVHR